MRILLLSHFFPPLSTIASHRAYGWARAWAELDHEVHVLTPTKYPIDGPLDLDLPTDGLVLHNVPYCGVGRRGSAKSKPSSGDVVRWARLKSKTRWLRQHLGLLGDVRVLLVPSLVRRGTTILSRKRFDVMVSTFGPPSNLIAASILAARTRLPWVIDYQDLWSQNYLNAGRFCGSVGTLLERALVRRAALLVTLSHGLARRIETTFGREAIVAYFGYLDDRDNPPSARYWWPDGRKRLVYAGRLYDKHQTIGPFLAAVRHTLSEAPKLGEQLCIEFFGPDQETLRRMIKTQGLDHLVRCNGLIRQADALAAERSATALLFLDWTDPAAEGVLTGKLFEYLRSRLPIAFIGSGFQTEASQIACRTGAALILQNFQAVKKFLQEWPASVPTVKLNEEFIGELSCRRQAQLVITEIEERLMRRGGRP